jgi:hypothetical protein
MSEGFWLWRELRPFGLVREALMLDVACLGEDGSRIAAQAGSAITMFPGLGSRGGDPS